MWNLLSAASTCICLRRSSANMAPFNIVLSAGLARSLNSVLCIRLAERIHRLIHCLRLSIFYFFPPLWRFLWLSLLTHIISIEVHTPAHPSTCQQTAAQSADATSFDMVKQYCTSSLLFYLSICEGDAISSVLCSSGEGEKKPSPKGKSVAARILQRLISALLLNKRINNVLS